MNHRNKAEPSSLERMDVPRLRDLVKKLGAALDHQNEEWGLYGEKSKAALREWKEWETRHIGKLTD
jgi:hypothetical protein